MCFDQLLEISKGLLTPLIAAVTAYIAFQQWKTNQQKLILDRYDRRLRMYEEVRKILSIIFRDGKASYDDLIKFRIAVSEADFLFGSEIPEYLNDIYTHGVQLRSWSDQYRDYTQAIPEGYDHQKVCDGMQTELKWLISQAETAKEKFKKYLDISY